MRRPVVLFRVLLALILFLSARLSVAEGTDPITVPIQLHGTYLYIDLRINDKPATFVIDTGAGVNVVTPEAAARLGLVAGKEKVNAVGGGGSGGAASQTTIATLEIGSEQLRNQSAYILALPEALASDGLLGTPFLRKYAVTIDYERRQLTMVAPDAFKSPRGASAFKVSFRGATPFIEGKADGRKGWFRIDTGAGDAITLFKPFVEKERLRDDAAPAQRMPTGRGVGGLVYGELARLHEFSLGDFKWQRPVADFSQQTTGAFADTQNAGNLGGDLWQRFTVTLDYDHNKVYLAPNSFYNKPFRTPRSGVSIDWDNGLQTVIYVAPNSPGSEAGILQGDIVLAVNGTPIEQVKSWDLSALLRGEPGTKLRLRIRSADKSEREVTLTLRDLL